MNDSKNYTENDVKHELQKLLNIVANLENKIPESTGMSEGDANGMPKRMRDKVLVNGQMHWLNGYCNQDLHDAYVDLLEREGLIQRIDPEDDIPLLVDYMTLFYSTYKTKQQKNTIVNRERIIRNHIAPRFGKNRIDTITTMSIQKWFNEMAEQGYSKETILKIKNTLSPIFDSAVEDEIITKNPIKSKRLENNGKPVIHHKALPADKLKEIKIGLKDLESKVKWMGSLLCYTGMRFEEVLGCRFEDFKDNWIVISRAVVHPDRNKPVIKCTKTLSSERMIPCPVELANLLKDGCGKGFVLASSKDPTGETPLSYTEARRVFDKLRKRFDIHEYSAHDFRDTCATVWRENGIPLDIIARMLGHAKTETTERRYVKYRTEVLDDIRKLM